MKPPSRLTWRTSTYTGDGENCVEVAPTDDGVLMRDTKDHGHGPVIPFQAESWVQFLQAVGLTATKVGGVAVDPYPLQTQHDRIVVNTRWHVRCSTTGAMLHFTAGEWSAFLLGVRDGEFDFIDRHFVASR